MPGCKYEPLLPPAAALAEHWLSPNGGFVFSDYGDDAAIGIVNPDIKLTMYEAFSRVSERIYGNPLPEPVPATIRE